MPALKKNGDCRYFLSCGVTYMIKRTVLLGVMVFAAAGAALADGVYLGAGLGGLQLQNKLVGSVTDASTDKHTTTNTLIKDYSVGLNGTLLAGYTWDWANQYVLGVEGFYNTSSAKTSHTLLSETVKLKLNDVYGARILPGLHLTSQTVGYAILGVARGNIKLSDSGKYGSASDRYNLNAYQLGLGAITHISKEVALRADFIYSDYQNKTIYSGTTSGYSSTLKLEPSTMELNLVGVYQFG